MQDKPISQSATTLIEAIKTCKGQFIRVRYRTNVKTAAAHKAVSIIKTVEGIFRTGIDYANLGSVKSAIASGERGEVQGLNWGEWAVFPWIITHKDKEYLRLYPVESVTPLVNYVVQNDPAFSGAEHVNATKEDVSKYLTPADARNLLNPDPNDRPSVITKPLADVEFIGCWHNEVSDEEIAAAEARS